MAELAGYGGNVYYNASLSKAVGSITSAIGGVNNWTCNIATDALETTDFGDSGARTYIAGLTGWNGTFAGNYSASVTYSSVAPGTKVSLRLDLGSSKEIIGNVLLTGMNFTDGVDGVNAVNWTFNGSGSYTIG